MARSDRSFIDDPDRLLIRDVSPRTPCDLAVKTVVGDAVAVGAQLVADGHDILAARLNWRRQHPPKGRAKAPAHKWRTVAMEVDDWGHASGAVTFDEPGDFEFRIQAWRDRYATWVRDLRLRIDAGEDVAVEFLEGAEILAGLRDVAESAERDRLTEAVDQLRSTVCADRVRADVAFDAEIATIAAKLVIDEHVTSSARHRLRVDRELAVRGSWYEFFARSEGGFGKGANSWRRLERIAEAGFDVVYLPPIHPIGVTARKGRNNALVASEDDVGSPWAIGSAQGGHIAVDPALGTVDDFRAFVARAAELGLEVALDYALQCSPDHPWVTEHPEWFSHRVDGSIRYAENPPKKYQDIYPINFWPTDDSDRIALWEACLGILKFWIDQGVEVFRVDNPHTKPIAFWQWIIAEVQRSNPRVVFLSEAFTDPPMMHSLAEIGFSQSYTYFTWRQTKAELTDYGMELAHAPAAGWFRPNLWPSTPDILTGDLRGGPRSAFAQRALLAATLAPSWGVYSGYELCENDPYPGKEEYHFSEKYQLYSRDHDTPDSLWSFISNLNRIRREHRAMWRMDTLHFHHVDNDDVIAFSHARQLDDATTDRVLVVATTAPAEVREATVYVDHDALLLDPSKPLSVTDELTGEHWEWSGQGDYVRIDPAERVGHVLKIVPVAGSLRV